MQLAGIVAGHLTAGGVAVVDAVGQGAGVVSRLREQHKPVVAFVAGAGSTAKDSSGSFGFVNQRAEAWWRLREMLADPESEIALPPDPILLGELTAPGWKTTSNGRIQVESKDEIAKRLGKLESRKALDEGGSTNRADAVVQAFAIVQPQYSYEGGVNIGERAVYADDPEGDGWGDEMSEEY